MSLIVWPSKPLFQLHEKNLQVIVCQSKNKNRTFFKAAVKKVF